MQATEASTFRSFVDCRPCRIVIRRLTYSEIIYQKHKRPLDYKLACFGVDYHAVTLQILVESNG